jgi:hypothetical protein
MLKSPTFSQRGFAASFRSLTRPDSFRQFPGWALAGQVEGGGSPVNPSHRSVFEADCG